MSENFNPKISVCIPSYEANGRGVEFIDKNVQSILSQTYKNIETDVNSTVCSPLLCYGSPCVASACSRTCRQSRICHTGSASLPRAFPPP